MPEYEFRATYTSGAGHEGSLEAESLEEARRALEVRGLYVEHIAEMAPPSPWWVKLAILAVVASLIWGVFHWAFLLPPDMADYFQRMDIAFSESDADTLYAEFAEEINHRAQGVIEREVPIERVKKQFQSNHQFLGKDATSTKRSTEILEMGWKGDLYVVKTRHHVVRSSKHGSSNRRTFMAIYRWKRTGLNWKVKEVEIPQPAGPASEGTADPKGP